MPHDRGISHLESCNKNSVLLAEFLTLSLARPCTSKGGKGLQGVWCPGFACALSQSVTVTA